MNTVRRYRDATLSYASGRPTWLTRTVFALGKKRESDLSLIRHRGGGHANNAQLSSTRGPRALHIVDTLGMGGAETWLMELLRLWHQQGPLAPHIDILASSGNPGMFDSEARALGAHIFYLRYCRRHLGAFCRGLRKILSQTRYDVIHDHQDYVSGWHFLMGINLLPAVRVTHVHSPWIHIEADYAISPSRRISANLGKQLVSRLATHVCGTSREVLEVYSFLSGNAGGPMVSVVHCGIDIAKFNRSREQDRPSVLAEFGWPADTRLILFAGRLDRALELDHPQNEKNSWFALTVARMALNKDPRVRLLMVGAGDEPRRRLRAQIRDWGLTDQLQLPGLRKDIPRLMRAADVLFFPSRHEGLGMVAVEAQAACLPVLASTTVPRECCVVPPLFNTLSLSEPATVWADSLLRVMAHTRPSLEMCRIELSRSAFSITNSARMLEQVYSRTIPCEESLL